MNKEKVSNEIESEKKNVDMIKGKDDRLCYELCVNHSGSQGSFYSGQGTVILKGEVIFKNTDGFLSAELRSYK